MYSSSPRHAIVTIMPEIVLPDPIFGHDTNSLSKHRRNLSCKRRVLRYQTETGPWPLFVYDFYDIDRVIDKIKEFLAKMKIGRHFPMRDKHFSIRLKKQFSKHLRFFFVHRHCANGLGVAVLLVQPKRCAQH